VNVAKYALTKIVKTGKMLSFSGDT
jgi:hypothetical protein